MPIVCPDISDLTSAVVFSLNVLFMNEDDVAIVEQVLGGDEIDLT